MKKYKFFFGLILLSFTIISNAQQIITASGGNATGTGGNVSYTVGQVAYIAITGSGGSIMQGVQIPYEISVITAIDIASNVNLSYSVYPNPTSDYLILKIENENITKFGAMLYDLKGNLVKSVKIYGADTKIDMLQYPSAVYFLKVIDKNKEVKTFKIIKK
jgi:hypothetical protein